MLSMTIPLLTHSSR